MALNISDKDINILDKFEPSEISTFGKFLDWIHSWINTLREKSITDRDAMEKSVVFGTYVGSGETEKFINLGFTPVAVEVYAQNGMQSFDYSTPHYYYGGLALKDNPCMLSSGSFIIKIEGEGFYVAFNDTGNHDILTNKKNTKYYFKAYRYGEVK